MTVIVSCAFDVYLEIMKLVANSSYKFENVLAF